MILDLHLDLFPLNLNLVLILILGSCARRGGRRGRPRKRRTVEMLIGLHVPHPHLKARKTCARRLKLPGYPYILIN
jgi:hypothetical protein